MRISGAIAKRGHPVLSRCLDIKRRKRYDVFMRTTLTLDPDVAQALKSRIGEGRTLKQVVNETLRIGLSTEVKKHSRPFQVTPHSFGFQPGLDPDKLNQLADELEVQAFVSAAARKRR